MPPRKKNKNPACWTDDNFRIFISHLSTNKTEAQELKNYLETFAITGFVAHSDIETSREWQKEIELALKTCDAFTCLLVPEFHKSNWTNQEVGFVLARNIPVYPASLDGTVPYGFLAKVQAHFVRDDIGRLAKIIYSSEMKNRKTQRKLANAILNYLADSPSFVAANDRSILLNDISFWDETLIKKLKQIYDRESQVNGAMTTSNRVQRILKQFKSKNGRSLGEIFTGKWLNNYRHHSGRSGNETIEIKNNDEYYANDESTFLIDQVEISDDLKTVKFRKTRIEDGSQSINNLALIRDNVYSGTEAGADGVSKVRYKKLS